jgi:hypothetical protein
MFRRISDLFNRDKKLKDIITYFNSVYSQICEVNWRDEQYQFISGKGPGWKRLSTAPDHLPDNVKNEKTGRPALVRNSWLRTEFQKNHNGFLYHVGGDYRFGLELKNVKAGWLKGDIAETVRWYLKNLEAASDDIRIAYAMQGAELFTTPDLLESMDDNERVDINIVTYAATVMKQEELKVPVRFTSKDGRELYRRNVSINQCSRLDHRNEFIFAALKGLKEVTYINETSPITRIDVEKIEHIQVFDINFTKAEVKEFAENLPEGRNGTFTGYNVKACDLWLKQRSPSYKAL